MSFKPNTRATIAMTDAAKKARAEYAKEWRRKNPEKQQAILMRYWEKKSRELKNSETAPEPDEGNECQD